jgi:ribosome-binding factor A
VPSKRYSRLDRVNRALTEVVADELERLGDERLDLVTVTGARVESDLRHAVIWYSARSAPDPEIVPAVLASHRVRLQAAVGRQLRLKRTPELSFSDDPAIATGTRVEEILRSLRPAGPSPGEGEDGTSG